MKVKYGVYIKMMLIHFRQIPHAHNIEKRLILDLSTGDLYIKRRPAGKMKKKDLIKIRSLMKNISPPE